MAGVDIANQFPNSRMAQAVKLGQSQMRSVDAPSQIQLPNQRNVNIAAAVGLTLPVPSAASPGNYMPATYAVITAIGGPLYATYDGTAPSAANYAVVVQAGSQLPVQGAAALAAIKVFGTTMSVSYWS